MEDDELEALSAFVHGALAFGHILGVIYNLKRRNWKAVGIHFGAFAFDMYCVYVHLKARRE